MAARANITVDLFQNEGNIVLPFELLNGTDPLNITGWAISFRIGLRSNKNLVTKTVGDGITITDGAAGELTVTLGVADLTRTPAVYTYEMRRTDSGTVRTLVTGQLTIIDSLFGS